VRNGNASSGSLSGDTKSVSPVAPWWHTAIILFIFLGASLISASQHGLERVDIPGLSARLSSYLTVMVEEWVAVGLVWVALRRCRIGLRSFIGGCWNTETDVAIDIGFAFALAVVCLMMAAVLTWAFGGFKIGPNPAEVANTPHAPIEVVVWVALAATAGFCEELIFRGYLQRQFSAWTGSIVSAVLIQALAFGLSHGYKRLEGIVVAFVYGCLFGFLAAWRRSLRPGMIAHACLDTLGGLAAYFLLQR
jgi:membrane protease YdiL (CAAX protease family)